MSRPSKTKSAALPSNSRMPGKISIAYLPLQNLECNFRKYYIPRNYRLHFFTLHIFLVVASQTYDFLYSVHYYPVVTISTNQQLVYITCMNDHISYSISLSDMIFMSPSVSNLVQFETQYTTTLLHF